MTKCLVHRFIVLLPTLFFSLSAWAQETYIFDNLHSYVMYHINHLGFSTSSGKWFFTGNLILDEAKPQNSKVNVTIPIAKIDAGVPALDDHLRGKIFFDAVTYPTATFVSNKVIVTGKDTAKVEGILTLHGVSRQVTLEVRLNKTGINLVTEKQSVGFSARTELKRSDFGIMTLLPEVGDEVKIEIEAEAGLATAVKP